jgi:uncharacterized membrane protein
VILVSDPRFAGAPPQPAYQQQPFPPGPTAGPAGGPLAGPRRPSVAARRWTNAMLAVGIACMGLMAGLFFGFTVSVMPGLQAGDDTTFVTAMQNINAAIENGLFGLTFSGALIFPAIATVLLFVTGRRKAALWAAGATVLYFLVLVLTMGIEVPLNDKLAKAGDPSKIGDIAKVRSDFENTWVPVNNIRTLLNCLAFFFLIPALWRPARENS